MRRFANPRKELDSAMNRGIRIEFVPESSCLLEGDLPVRAAVGFFGVGPSRGAVQEAMELFKKIKFPAAAFYLDSIEPFPVRALEAFAERVDKIVVVEPQSFPLVSAIIRERTWIKPVEMVPSAGGSISGSDIFGKEDWN